MKIKKFSDPYQEVIYHFNQNAVEYVVVGMAGINYYASNPSMLFSTLDYDIFIEPTLGNTKNALEILIKLKFEISTKEGLFKPTELKNVVRNQSTLMATTTEGIMIELILGISGYAFSEIATDTVIFNIGKVPVKVGKLTKLLNSKKIADRPKDRQFLKRYKSE